MLAVAGAAAADAVSLKLVKHAGLPGAKRVAAVAEAAGIGLYGGCLLKSPMVAAAHLRVFSTLREPAWGCEHVSVDEGGLRRYVRARGGKQCCIT